MADLEVKIIFMCAVDAFTVVDGDVSLPFCSNFRSKISNHAFNVRSFIAELVILSFVATSSIVLLVATTSIVMSVSISTAVGALISVFSVLSFVSTGRIFMAAVIHTAVNSFTHVSDEVTIVATLTLHQTKEFMFERVFGVNAL